MVHPPEYMCRMLLSDRGGSLHRATTAWPDDATGGSPPTTRTRSLILKVFWRRRKWRCDYFTRRTTAATPLSSTTRNALLLWLGSSPSCYLLDPGYSYFTSLGWSQSCADGPYWHLQWVGVSARGPSPVYPSASPHLLQFPHGWSTIQNTTRTMNLED